jgi:hypothetical protein
VVPANCFATHTHSQCIYRTYRGLKGSKVRGTLGQPAVWSSPLRPGSCLPRLATFLTSATFDRFVARIHRTLSFDHSTADNKGHATSCA